ncbi:MAG: ABC transporter permease subunit [Acidimicrobiales bacterium]
MTSEPSQIDPSDYVVENQRVADEVRAFERREASKRAVRSALIFSVFLVSLGAAYVVYKAFGTSIDDAQTEWSIVGSFLPATDDLRMPPLGAILTEFGEPVQRTSDRPLAMFILDAAWFTLRETVIGLIGGLIMGMAVAILLLRSSWLERGFMPWVIVSQTIPLIAIAPIIVIWGRTNFDFLPFEWADWMSVSVIAVYLSFFPVAVNGLRGLKSPAAADLELMNSYAASWSETLFKLRLPAAVPYLFPAVRLAATASVVGAIVGEISAGVPGGLGRLILDFASRYTTGPERLYDAVIGAALLGVAIILVLSLLERIFVSARGQGTVS